MMPLLILAFIAVPIVEIVVLIKVGAAIGAWTTIALLIATAVLGTAILRHQGLVTMARVQDSLARNVFPAAALFDGACLLLAGVLMLIPGFVSDAVGLLLLLPPLRALLRRLIWHHLARGEAHIWVNGEEAAPGPRRGPDDRTIEGEWREVEPPPDPRLDRDGREGRDGGKGGNGWGGDRR